jgi:hypothetical protein
MMILSAARSLNRDVPGRYKKVYVAVAYNVYAIFAVGVGELFMYDGRPKVNK